MGCVVRARKGDVVAMVGLLEAEHGDVEELAKQALALAWSLGEARPKMAAIIDQPGVGVVVAGPFETPAQASKYLDRFSFTGPGRAKVLVTRMLPPDGDTMGEVAE